MGRKPNALILQHFERGAKLNDSSNRYQHTCKSCGEKFPKGRIDSLTTHLVKKCPGISLQDRQKALLELNGFSSDAARNQNGEVQLNGPTVELPIGTRNWTALETLAEVSRQIGTNDHPDGKKSRSTPDPQKQEQLEVREQYTLDNPPLSYEQHIQRGRKTSSQKQNRREQNEATLQQPTFPHLSHSRSASPNLAMAASSMAAAQAAARFIPDMVDPQLLADDSRQLLSDAANRHVSESRSLEQDFNAAGSGMSDGFFSQPHDQHGQWIMDSNLYSDPNVTNSMQGTSATASSYPRITMSGPMTTEFSTEYGNGEKPHKPKVRGKFDNSRRQEVQEVRKIGACIRCRMLKKNCSTGDPCDTCKGIEAARLWKTPCIRTRLDTILDMYALGLHSILARHDSNSQKNQVKFSNSPFHIDASHYPHTGIYATFKAIQGQKIPVEGNIDPGLSGDFPAATVRMLDDDNDDLPLKLEAYTKRMLSTFIDNETSHFVKVTLTTALELSTQNMSEWSSLLTRVLDLWASVHILVDGGGWNFSERTDLETQPGQGPLIDPTLHGKTYALLVLQLEAAAEKKAAQLSKTVINDVERDLLLSKSTGSFAHFLVAVILLHCIEKSTWLFQCWEQDEFKARWPLDKQPSHFTSQGDKVTNFLQMLLRIRKILPKTYQKADGTMGTEADSNASQYFEKCQLNYNHVLNQQTNFVFDKSNSNSFDFRFVSKLLLSNT